MFDWRRYLMGISILILLVPVAEISTAGGVEGILRWFRGEGTSTLAGSPSIAYALESASEGSFHPESADSQASTSTEILVERHPPHDEATSTDQPSTSSTADDAPSSSSEKQSETSTPSPSPEEAEGVSSGVLSGAVCPCTVTGTVELKESVTLKGDLIVDGGKLVARSGVTVDGNGFQIMFTNGGKADFQGTPTSTWSGDGSNANLKRDINFTKMKRIMFMGAGPSILKYFTVSDSGTPTLGDYPLHWHLNGNSTRGTLVEGVVVVNGANHAFVPHGSHGITFKNTIAKNIRGSAYWWDPVGTNGGCSRIGSPNCTMDNSNDIRFEHALAYGVSPASGSNGHRVAGFNLGAGSGNVVRDSAAMGISGGADCAGFQWPEDANQNAGGNVWTFRNNISKSSACHGIFVWQNDNNGHVIDGFSGGGVDHGAYANVYQYRNIDVPYLEVHAAGWKVVGGHIGSVITRKHRNAATPTVVFQDVKIDGFTVVNAEDGGDIPGWYVLNGTGLSCGDIQYQSVVSGTKVVIDGVEC
jgi:hypothetical protein